MTEDNYNSEYSESLNMKKPAEESGTTADAPASPPVNNTGYYSPPPASSYGPPPGPSTAYTPPQYGSYAPAPNVYVPAPVAPINKYATISLILSIAGFFFSIFTAIPGVIFGHIALNQIKKNGYEGGKGLALAGLIIGYILSGFAILYIGFFALITIFSWISLATS